jgi:chemotaxis signal transduction protein
MFTVINALVLLKAAESAGTATRRLLVALTGAEQLALVADRVKEVIEAETGDINAPEESASSLISGILEKDGQRILVLDVDQLFPSAIRGRERRRRRT